MKTLSISVASNNAEIYLHFPSFIEGAPIRLYEAQATGLP